jgi:hypothetical protein
MDSYAGCRKEDASPVTDADEQAETLIVRDLARLTPDLPICRRKLPARAAFPMSEAVSGWSNMTTLIGADPALEIVSCQDEKSGLLESKDLRPYTDGPG